MKKVMLLFALMLFSFTSPAYSAEDSSGWRKSLPRILKERCAPYYETFYREGLAQNVSPYLLMAIAARETACRSVRSVEKGDNGEYAWGVMQVQPTTERTVGIPGNPLNPHHSIRTGSKYLGTHLRRSGYRSAEQLIIAYRWGPGGAKKKLGKEYEQGYVRDVIYAWDLAPCVVHPEYHPHCRKKR